MSRDQDTIAALGTPAGTSALAVLRVSGPDTRRLSLEIFRISPLPRRARHDEYRDRAGALLDDVVWIFFEGPRSYTGEDSMEISCHGNPFIAQKILEDLLARGCRAAAPGEFTQRAFLNGRMDLSQAEAVMDVIHARSERSLAAANRQLRGALGRRMDRLIEQLLGVLAQIEAYIDFPEEDLPPENQKKVRDQIRQMQLEISDLMATRRYGELLRDGIRTVIIGAPNAGKSSLLNRLVGTERALVSAEPGTTRDFIEERIIVGPHCLRLIDTAGLNPSPAPLERLGMEKTLERAEEADLFLLVFDATEPTGVAANQVLKNISRDNAIAVFNKVDLPHPPTKSFAIPADVRRADVSALTGEGIVILTEMITELADGKTLMADEEFVVINARHADALGRSKSGLLEAEAKLTGRAPVELLASDLRGALAALGEIAGRIDNERMLDQLFASFCIGK